MKFELLDDICRKRHGGNENSEAANEKAAPNKASQRAKVFAAIKTEGSLTCRELAERWGVGLNQISGRFSELKKQGKIYQSGRRNGCGVWFIYPFG